MEPRPPCPRPGQDSKLRSLSQPSRNYSDSAALQLREMTAERAERHMSRLSRNLEHHAIREIDAPARLRVPEGGGDSAKARAGRDISATRRAPHAADRGGHVVE